jgi:hypothetical protein
MEKNEKKALEVFVIVLSSFYCMCSESEEGKQEFARVLQRMMQKIKGDLKR